MLYKKSSNSSQSENRPLIENPETGAIRYALYDLRN